jgi:hypothetical protein
VSYRWLAVGPFGGLSFALQLLSEYWVLRGDEVRQTSLPLPGIVWKLCHRSDDVDVLQVSIVMLLGGQMQQLG